MTGFWGEWAGLLLRWLHVVAAIAWIGESFYFVMLDRTLRKAGDAAPDELGASWSVHGGGFYHKQKYRTAPARTLEDLHWSKWKSYTTWMSGFALFALLYLASPHIYLIDPRIAPWTAAQAVVLALAFPVVGWLLYDGLCRLLGFRDLALGIGIALLVALMCHLATHWFAGRAAFLLVGATLATWMSANVFWVIIPGQKKMVSAIASGTEVDLLPGLRGKQRSVHNTYFTLPVVFAMLSIHSAALTGHPRSGLVLMLFMAMGVAIRQFFVLWHSRQRRWGLLVLALLLLGVATYLLRAVQVDGAAQAAVAAVRPITPAPAGAAETAPTTLQVGAILQQRCAACHSERPRLMASPPLGAKFDSSDQVEAYADKIHQQVVVAKTMPPGNITGLTEEERSQLDLWFAARQKAR